MEIVTLSTDRLHPNDYNPNTMTPDEFDEMVAEVRRLGRLPKPVVVRQNAAGYVIVDGEHGWRAAVEVGLANVPCEVIEADDFEAMRQTYKRNQHGTHAQVRQGRMFRAMMERRGLSQRDLAKEVEVSEGTIRNSMVYAQAADLRNDYAFDGLSIRRVRVYVRLPRLIADMWLDTGADLKALWEAKTLDDVEDNYAQGNEDGLMADYDQLAAAGLVDLLPKVHRPSGFVDNIKRLREWHKFEWSWSRGGLTAEVLRPYTVHYHRCVWALREASLMDNALDYLVDKTVTPVSFRLTPEEFSLVVESQPGASHDEFLTSLQLAIVKRCGPLPEKVWQVREELSAMEIQFGAPDYIQTSSLRTEERYALWKVDAPECAKREIAGLSSIPKGKKEDLRDAIKRLAGQFERRERYRDHWENMTSQQMASEIAGRLPLYDPKRDADAIAALAATLATLTKAELMVLNEYTEAMRHWKEYESALRALLGR